MTVTHIFRAIQRPGNDPAGTVQPPAAPEPLADAPPALTRPEGGAARMPRIEVPQEREAVQDTGPDPRASEGGRPDRVIAPAMPTPPRPLARYVGTDGRIILVAKARGGIGATTLAVNLALEMQLQGMKRSGAVGGRVALVDLDVQLGNAGSLLDLADRGGMLALAKLGPEPDAQAVRHAMVRHGSGLGVLAAPSTAIPFEAFDPLRIASILDALTTEHDVVVVDLPPALIDWLEPVLARAERLLMVTDLAVPSVMRARRIIALMTEDRPELPVDIVVAHERKPFRLGQSHRDAAEALGHPLRHWLPDETKLARQAMDRGEPLIQLAPRCGWSRAVRDMATELQTARRTGARANDKKDD
jgi:pilus assembly protein CpaE